MTAYCGSNASSPVYNCADFPLLRLESGSSITDWPLTRRFIKTGDIEEVERLSSIRNVSVDVCRRLIILIKEIYTNALSRRLNELVGKATGSGAYQPLYLLPAICFESCKFRQVFRDFMDIRWTDRNEENARRFGHLVFSKCEREIASMTRNWPSSGDPPIHHQIRSAYNSLLDWGCCTRSSCPLDDRGRYATRRDDWAGMHGPPRARKRR